MLLMARYSSFVFNRSHPAMFHCSRTKPQYAIDVDKVGHLSAYVYTLGICSEGLENNPPLIVVHQLATPCLGR